jgi:hypothetical protein
MDDEKEYEEINTFIKIIRSIPNTYPIDVLPKNDVGVISFDGDIAIPYCYIECEFNGKIYYGQSIFILKENK